MRRLNNSLLQTADEMHDKMQEIALKPLPSEEVQKIVAQRIVVPVQFDQFFFEFVQLLFFLNGVAGRSRPGLGFGEHLQRGRIYRFRIPLWVRGVIRVLITPSHSLRVPDKHI